MKIVTITLPVLALLFCVASCDASANTPADALETAPTAKYSQFFLVGGKQVDAATAIVQALNGREAFKCTSVTAKVSASGTSIGIKAIKKPRKN
jgi:ABC-type phosphate transport system substrate-binding protein